MARPLKSAHMPAETEGINTKATESALAEARVGTRELAAMDEERLARAGEAAKLIGYTGALSPEVAESFIASGIQRTAEGVWLLGAGLIMLKELTPHGEFMKRVESMGISASAANKRMAAVLKFAKTGAAGKFHGAVSGARHLLELAELDVDDLNLLASGGAIAGVTLDKVDRMTVRQLREALRESQAQLEVSNAARDRQSARIDELEMGERRYVRLTSDEQLQVKQKRLVDSMSLIRASIATDLRHAIGEVRAHDQDASAHEVLLAGVLTQIRRDLDALRDEFGLGTLIEALPDWLADDMQAKEMHQAHVKDALRQ